MLVASLAAQGLDTTLAEARLGVQESELNALLVHRELGIESPMTSYSPRQQSFSQSWQWRSPPCPGASFVHWIHPSSAKHGRVAISSVRMKRPGTGRLRQSSSEKSSANGTSYDVIGLSIPSSRCTSKAFNSLSCTPRRASASVVSRPCAARDATSAAWRASRASAVNKSESKSFSDVGLAHCRQPAHRG